MLIDVHGQAESNKRRALHNQLQDMVGSLRVACRVRPYDLAKQAGHKYELAFANGGDQNNNTIPETEICNKYNIKLIDGLGEKIQSSSWLLKNN